MPRLPEPGAARSQELIPLIPVSKSEHHLVFRTGGGQSTFLFWKGGIIAVRAGDIVYFRCAAGAEQRAVNKFYPDDPHVRASMEQLDFIVGQVLTTSGLPLTRREPDAQ